MYLRPSAIRRAAVHQIAEELAEWTTEYNSKGEPLTVMGKFDVYMANRRNKPQVLKRFALPMALCELEEDGSTPKATSSSLLSSVANFVDLTSDPQESAQAQARAQWLSDLATQAIAPIKKEEERAASAPEDVSMSAVEEIAAKAAAATVEAAAAAAAKQVPAARRTFGTFSSASRSRPRGAAAAAPFSLAGDPDTVPPAQKAGKQLDSTKAESAADKAARAKQRSAAAAAATAAATGGDSSDDENVREQTSARATGPAGQVQPPPKPTPPPPPPKKQAKLPAIKAREILTSDPLYSKAGVEPELTKANAGGRFLLAPPSLWASYAQDGSGGFIGKVKRIVNTSAQIRFQDGLVWLGWDTVSAFKALS